MGGLTSGLAALKRRGLVAGIAALVAGAFQQGRTEVAHAAPIAGDSNTVVTAGVTGANTLNADDATGVFGTTTGTTGAVVGVWGRTDSTHFSTKAVFGEARATIGRTTAVWGRVHSTTQHAAGVFGDSNAAGGYGVFGRSTSGAAIFGVTTNGYAGSFTGPVVVQGSFTVSGGPKSAAVPHPDGSHRRVYCQEATEAWFEDFGRATLTNGRAIVDLDPDFEAVVKGDDYMVFPAPEGPCNSLYVSRLGPRRFVVEEINKGQSSIPFSYRVVSRRRDNVGKRLEKVDLRNAAPSIKLPDAIKPHGETTIGLPSRPHTEPSGLR